MGLGNGLSSHEDLRSPAIRTWGLALKWARQAKGFSQRNVAENVNVSIETVQLWEQDDGKTYPSSVKLARLHGMMPQLRHFKFLIPKSEQKHSDFQEVAAARKEASKPEPPPEPTKTNDEKFLAALTAISNRHGSYRAVAEKAGMTQSGFSRLFHNKFCSPDSYAQLLRAYPELRSVPMPTIRGGNGKIYGPTDQRMIDALGSLLDEVQAAAAPPPPPKAEAAPASVAARSPGASVPSSATSVSSVAPGPAPVAEAPRPPASTLEELSALYAKELRRLEAASKRYEEAMLAAMTAEEDKKAAEAAATDVLSRLQVAAGLKREA